MNLLQLIGSLELGLIYGLVALGVYLTFRVIDFADMTVDGSFPLGAAVCAAALTHGFSPEIATLFAFLAGGLAGSVTGILNVRFRILGLLAGILTMTALYSVNLRIMGRPNIALLDSSTVFGKTSVWLFMLIFVVGVAGLLVRLLASHIGLAMRAIGVNPAFSRANGVPVGSVAIGVLALSNAIVATAGALFAQSQGFADIGMGTGTVVIGLASVIIGEAIFPSRAVWCAVIGCIAGSILYRIVVAFALNSSDIGLQASDLNLITAALVALTMILPNLKNNLLQRRRTL